MAIMTRKKWETLAGRLLGMAGLAFLGHMLRLAYLANSKP